MESATDTKGEPRRHITPIHVGLGFGRGCVLAGKVAWGDPAPKKKGNTPADNHNKKKRGGKKKHYCRMML